MTRARFIASIVRVRTRDGRTHYARYRRSLCGVSIDSAHECDDTTQASCRRCRAAVVDVISAARQLPLFAPTDEDMGRAARFWTDLSAGPEVL